MAPPLAPTVAPVAPSRRRRIPPFACTNRLVSGLNVAHALGMVLLRALLKTTGGGVMLFTSTTQRFSPPTSAASFLPLRESVWQATHWPTSFGVMNGAGAASLTAARITPACVVDQ